MQNFGFHCILNESTELSKLQSAPQAGHLDRRTWESTDPEIGPIGSIVSTVFRMGAALDLENMIIHKYGEVLTSFLTVPYNHLRRALQTQFIRARSRAANGRRALNEGLEEAHMEVSKFAFAKLPIEAHIRNAPSQHRALC